jgi:aspartate/methionine/tyrosine aminotransferase
LKWIIDLHEAVEPGAIKMFGSGIAADDELRKELLSVPCLELPHYGHGHPELIEAIRQRYDPGHTAGEPVLAEAASGALLLVCFALLKTGDVVLVETPGYQPLSGAVEIAGANAIPVRRHGTQWELDIEDLQSAAARTEEAKLLILTNPHNPTGALMDKEALIRIADAFTAVRPGGKVVVDEVFLDLVPNNLRPPRAATIDSRFISVSSLTKSHGLGWLRCGWVLAEEELQESLHTARRRDQQFGSDLLQCLAIEAFRRLDAFEASAHATLSVNQAMIAETVLPLIQTGKLEGLLPSFGGVCFLGIPGKEDAGAFVESLENSGVYVSPGIHFGAPDRFRMNYGITSNDLRIGLAELANILA